MKTFRLKTTLKCNHCVDKVKDRLDTALGIVNWSIDLKTPERILTVVAEQETVIETIKEILTENGFRVELCPE